MALFDHNRDEILHHSTTIDETWSYYNILEIMRACLNGAEEDQGEPFSRHSLHFLDARAVLHTACLQKGK